MENMIRELVVTWAEKVGIFKKGTPQSQFRKTLEEVEEFKEAMEAYLNKPTYSSWKEMAMEFGDIEVTLTILAKKLNLDRMTCELLAHNKNSQRTGKMVDGQFKKD